MSADRTRPGGTRGWQAWTLVAVECLVACQAVSGGIGLINDRWQLPVVLLTRTPFATWAGPGWLLIGLIAVPHALAATSVVVLPSRPRLGILAGVLAGSSLVVWIAVQLALLQVYFFLQPVVVAMGLLEIALALRWRHRLQRVDTAPGPAEESGTNSAPTVQRSGGRFAGQAGPGPLS